MRRRDVIWGVVLWGGLLAALAWAAMTGHGWVQAGSRPAKAEAPGKGTGGEEEAPAPQPSATGVIGSVDEGTREALAKGLAQKNASTKATKPPGKVP